MGIDLSEFYKSVEWDILGVPAARFFVRADDHGDDHENQFCAGSLDGHRAARGDVTDISKFKFNYSTQGPCGRGRAIDREGSGKRQFYILK